MKKFRHLAGLVVAATLVAQFAPARAAPRPIADYFAHDAVEMAEISPGGTKLAALMTQDGVRALRILPLDGKPAVTIGLPDADLNRIRWVGEDWLLASVGEVSREFGGDAYIRRIIAIKADGSKMKRLQDPEQMADVGDQVLWVSRSGKPQLLLAYRRSVFRGDPGFYPRVALVDVESGHFTSVVDPMLSVWDWYADTSGTVRVGIGSEQNGLKSRAVYRDRDGQGFREIVLADSDKVLPVPLAFLKEPDKALAYSSHDGHVALYNFDLKTMTLGTKAFSIPGYDIDYAITSDLDGHLMGVAYTDQAPRQRWFEPSYIAAQELVEGAIPGASATIASSSDDDRKFVMRVNGGGKTGAYLLDMTAKRLTPLGASQSAQSWNPIETYHYKARDGLDIEAFVTFPFGKPRKNLPVVIMPHGGPHARDKQAWDFWQQYIADQGYLVIQPNYRGSTGYGLEFEKAGLGQWGLKMQDDLDDALAWAGSKGFADTKRACMVGGSYGGFAAMRAAQRNPELYRCAISFAGISDLGKMIKSDTQSFFGDNDFKRYWKGEVSDVAGSSPINSPSAFKVPLLLVHGKKDRRVPVDQSRMLFAKLSSNGSPVRYVEQDKGDHHFTRDEDKQQMLELTGEWLKKYNPAD